MKTSAPPKITETLLNWTVFIPLSANNDGIQSKSIKFYWNRMKIIPTSQKDWEFSSDKLITLK
jgi:hypothetical protein